MGVILCEDKKNDNKLYIEDLGINIYSLEELCYLIYSNTLLVLEDFVDKNLFDFIASFLEYNDLSSFLTKMYKDKKYNDDILCYILERSYIYSKVEINQFKREVNRYRSMLRSEYLKKRADYFLGVCRYHKAIDIYESILEIKKDKAINNKFLQEVYNNIGSAYAKLFDFKKAYVNFSLSYEKAHTRETLKKIYFLTKLDESLKYEIKEFLFEEDKKEFDKEYEELVKEYKTKKEISDLRLAFSYDSIKRKKVLSEIIDRVKKEYRKMI